MFDPDYDLFLDIIAAGSISGAARQRGMSTAAVSKRLVRLEERLSVRLVNRTTRRLALTTAGAELHATLLPVRQSLQAVEDRISGQHAVLMGLLRVTAPTSFGRMHVVPLLSQFIADNPGVSLSVDLSDEFVDLLNGSCDLAIRIGAKIGSGLVGHRLGTSQRVLCAAPSYIEKYGEPAKLSDLRNHRILAASSQLPWQLSGREGTITFSGQSHVNTNSSEVVRELALAGCGIALRSLWDVSDALQQGSLRRVLPEIQGSRDVGIFAVHAPMPVMPARLTSLIEHLTLTLKRNLTSR